MNEIISAFLEHGLVLKGSPVLDGKIHRFKAPGDRGGKESGWYVGFSNYTIKSGETFQVVVFGNYRTGETHQYQTGTVTYTAEDKRAIREQIEKAKKAQELARQKLQTECAAESVAVWETLDRNGFSPYLERKSLNGVTTPDLGCRFGKDGIIIVPMRNVAGEIRSFQSILGDGTKRFKYGGQVDECFHTIGEINKSGRVYICEGFSTGGSIFMATGITTVVTFNAGNLPKVARVLKKTYPEKSFIVCGDDDRSTTRKENGVEVPYNPGREKAEEAAKLCLGRAVFPRFKS